MVSIQEFDYTVRHIKGKDNVVADAFSRLCVLNGGTSTRKVSGQKRIQDTPAGEEGSRRSLRLGLKKQASETSLLEHESAEATGGEIDTHVNPIAPQTKRRVIRVHTQGPKSIDLPVEKIDSRSDVHEEGVGLDKVPDEMMHVDSPVITPDLIPPSQVDSHVVLPEMISPPDLPELIPSVPKGERESSRPEIIILGEGETEPDNTLDKGTRDGDDTRLDN